MSTIGALTSSAPARPALGRRASFWVSAGVVGHTLWTSAAPAMTYPLYAEAWQLSHATITAIFAIYPIAVVAVLTGFGDLSDHIGRRAAMLLGLAASLLGVLFFAAAPDVTWLFAGRALMGLGVGLTAGPSTAAMVEFSAPDQAHRASAMTTAAQAIGFALALLLGGALIAYAPLPMRLSFWLLAVLLAGLLAAAWFLPRPVGDVAGRRWHPKVPSIPKPLRQTFTVAAAAVTTAYVHGVLILSLGAQVAHDLVGSGNAFVNGAALSLFAIMSGLVGILARPLPSRWAILAGAAASAAGVGLMALAVAQQALWLFLAATATAGSGYSLLFLGGLAVMTRAAPAQHRGGLLSALYLVAYLTMGSAALLLGQVATRYGLGLAVDLGAGAIALLSLAVILLAALSRKPFTTAPTAG